jgi:hypothetical protein
LRLKPIESKNPTDSPKHDIDNSHNHDRTRHLPPLSDASGNGSSHGGPGGDSEPKSYLFQNIDDYQHSHTHAMLPPLNVTSPTAAQKDHMTLPSIDHTHHIHDHKHSSDHH